MYIYVYIVPCGGVARRGIDNVRVQRLGARKVVRLFVLQARECVRGERVPWKQTEYLLNLRRRTVNLGRPERAQNEGSTGPQKLKHPHEPNQPQSCVVKRLVQRPLNRKRVVARWLVKKLLENKLWSRTATSQPLCKQHNNAEH